MVYSKTYFTSSSHKYTNMYLDIAKKEYLQSRIYLYNTHCISIVYFSFRGGKYCWSPLNQFHDLLMVCNLQMESHLFKECSVAYCHLYHWWGAVQGATEWLSLFKWHSRTKLCVVVALVISWREWSIAVKSECFSERVLSSFWTLWHHRLSLELGKFLNLSEFVSPYLK